jgi:hypothetical protein
MSTLVSTTHSSHQCRANIDGRRMIAVHAMVFYDASLSNCEAADGVPSEC